MVGLERLIMMEDRPDKADRFINIEFYSGEGNFRGGIRHHKNKKARNRI